MSFVNKTRKWFVLAAFSFVAAMSQLLWLNFAPVISLVQTKFNVSETQASLLILVFPLIYVLIALPSGRYIDKHDYRKGIGLGVLIMTVFSFLRIYDKSFFILLLAQIGIAISQPFIINGISKLVLDWFEPSESIIATGIGTMGMFIGMAAGMALTQPLISSFGFSGAMVCFALLTLISALCFFLVVKNKSGVPVVVISSQESFRSLLKDKNLNIIFILSFLGLGFFNGLTTWLELILAPKGINSEQAGIAGGVLILGGIVGAGVIPAISESFKRRKPFLIGSILVATLTLFPLCKTSSYQNVLIFSALQGFFFLPAFSLLIEMCSELVGQARAASATGILMLAGNLGGVLVVLGMEWVKGDSKDFSPAVNLLFVLLLISLGLSALLPETTKS